MVNAVDISDHSRRRKPCVRGKQGGPIKGPSKQTRRVKNRQLDIFLNSEIIQSNGIENVKLIDMTKFEDPQARSDSRERYLRPSSSQRSTQPPSPEVVFISSDSELEIYELTQLQAVPSPVFPSKKIILSSGPGTSLRRFDPQFGHMSLLRVDKRHCVLRLSFSLLTLFKLMMKMVENLSPALQQCVYELLNFNVSFSNVSPVIQSVLAFVKIQPNRLPSKATINNMNIQRLGLSHRHIAEQLRHQENTCILSDETNKFGTKYEGIHATDENGNYWVLGVREISTKAGKDVLQTLQQILGDIDVVSELSENPASIQILKNISSTMSDRASTQIKFNQLLEDFRTDENGLRSVPLERFRGSRFNILFRNAANVFFLEHQIRTYLAIEHSNRLLASINHDINVPEYVAGCKSLGLISELITVPLWCIIEDENLHIIEAKTLYQELVKYLEEFPQHIRDFMEGNYVLIFVDQAKLTSSKVFLFLTSDWEHDGKVEAILLILIPAMCVLCKKLFRDFLPDGTWFEASDTINEKTQSVPKHNKFSETIFGHMDRLLREKPNTTQNASEANMFVHNKTVEWLRKKTD
ncbi:hypothetical protein MAR_030352 [Mya arenaria]|uniref:Uncharacterized protein n=1 Tax=Mya arenaria TaxID=6604 RepID=A0ABY7DIY3_MYAAR|nr:hypothetical protein MAR_030352 [Mya arenaria]